MSRLTFQLAKAAANGRNLRWKPSSREEVLARLLVKRAEARQAGLNGLEKALRKQITWSLPMRSGEFSESLFCQSPRGLPLALDQDNGDHCETALHHRI